LGTDKFIFKYSKTEYQDIITYIIQTIDNDSNILNKLPTFHQNHCLISKRSFEQSTSEQLSKFKSIIFKGENMLVLTGGLGIDEWAFSQSFKKIISLDIDINLNNLARYNFNKLQINNIERLDCSAEVFLNQTDTTFDVVYIDPDRRVEGKREILLRNHQPNVIELLDKIKKITPKLLIKCSPLYDFEMALKEVEGIKTCYILSIKGEVKEMLLEIDFKTRQQDSIEIKCVDLKAQNHHFFECYVYDDNKPIKAAQIENYFYEIGSSIVKVRKHHHYAELKKLKLININAPFYTSDKLEDHFIGRIFKVIKSLEYSNSNLKNYLKNNHITKGNFKVRGLPFKTADLLKNVAITEGGEDYFFIFSMNGKNTMIHAKKI
jgi:hypothetical protein